MAQESDLKRFDAAQGPRIIGPEDGKLVDLGSIGARMMRGRGNGRGLLPARASDAAHAPAPRFTGIPVRTSTLRNPRADGRPAGR